MDKRNRNPVWILKAYHVTVSKLPKAQKTAPGQPNNRREGVEGISFNAHLQNGLGSILGACVSNLCEQSYVGGKCCKIDWRFRGLLAPIPNFVELCLSLG